MSDVWVGSTAPAISLLHDGGVVAVGEAVRPAFLAEHPRHQRLYAVDESAPGSIAAFAVDDRRALTRTGVTGSGGDGPCHLTVHPGGGWLYTTNYGDGVAAALALDDAGDLTGDRVDLPHHGHGPQADRQEGPHAHSSWVSTGGGWLVVADLGTDQLRAHRLDDGRPSGDPVLTTLPPGTGPRHVAVDGELLYVAGELSCEVLTVRWSEASGTGEVIGAVGVVTLPPRSGDVHTLSHLELVGDTLVVGVRGADTVAAVDVVDGIAARLREEVLTVAWPRHLTVVDDTVLVAGERADLVGVHPLGRGEDGEIVVGALARTIPAQAPMCLLPVR